MMEITRYRFDVVREPLVRPFAFKGGAFTEKWLTLTTLESDSGLTVCAPGGLAVLWSDAAVFAAHSEVGGNILMCAVAEYAAGLAQRQSQSGPVRPDQLVAAIFPDVHQYARTVTGLASLKKTFTLNSMVSLDLALWKLYAAENGFHSFDQMLPAAHGAALSHRHRRVAHIPLVSYGLPLHEVRAMADAGSFLFKVKIGQSGSEQEMVRLDCERLTAIHHEIGSLESPGAPGGQILYYLDANGRYRDLKTVQRLLEHVDAIGMLERIILLEEPFADPEAVDVSGLPVTVAADESAETVDHALRRMDAGYRALALKPAGKTLSESLAVAAAAQRRGVACFVADSACVPVLVEWNKNVAARLAPLPDLGMGALESNGAEHYRRWDALLAEHPCAGADWISPVEGVYRLTEDFYQRSGCVL